MNIYVPGDSAGMVIGGVLLGWLLTPLVLAFSIPASMARSYYSSNDTAIVLAFLGIGLAVVGLILLLVDVSRALRTVGHLVRQSASEQLKPAIPAAPQLISSEPSLWLVTVRCSPEGRLRSVQKMSILSGFGLKTPEFTLGPLPPAQSLGGRGLLLRAPCRIRTGDPLCLQDKVMVEEGAFGAEWNRACKICGSCR